MKLSNEDKAFIYNWLGFFMALAIVFLLTGCTIPDLSRPSNMIILGIPTTISPTAGGVGARRPHPWVYPDSVFCEWHPELCTGSNDI